MSDLACLGARTKYRKHDAVPAPNSYSLTTTVGQAPKYTMTARSNRGGFAEDLAKTPAPGQYNQAADPIKTKSPAYTMQGRTFMPSGESCGCAMSVCQPVLCRLSVSFQCLTPCRCNQEAWTRRTLAREGCREQEGRALVLDGSQALGIHHSSHC
jgi:hypothetical protein